MKKINSLSAWMVLGAFVFGYAANAAAQDTYRGEVSAAYVTIEQENDDFEMDIYGASLDYYFTEVATQEHPLAEAAFLERAGNVNITAATGDVDANFLLSEGDLTMFSAAVNYFQPNSPFFAGLEYSDTKLDDFAPTDIDSETEEIGVSLGYFPAKNLLVAFRYSQAEEEVKIAILPFPVDKTTDFDNYEIRAKYVNELGGGAAFNLEGGIEIKEFDVKDNTSTLTDDGSNTTGFVSGDYYINNSLSLGGGLEVNSGDDESAEGDTFIFRVRNFFTPRFSAAITYETFSADNSGFNDEDTIDIRLSARF